MLWREKKKWNAKLTFNVSVHFPVPSSSLKDYSCSSLWNQACPSGEFKNLSEHGGQGTRQLGSYLFLQSLHCCPESCEMSWFLQTLDIDLWTTLLSSKDQEQWFSKYGQESPGDLLAIKISGPSSDILSQKLGLGPKNVSFDEPSRWLWCLLQFENHWPRWHCLIKI